MKLICTDIDGVLTDGRVTLDVKGKEIKTISYRDLDAIGIGRRAGYEFAFVTGEDTPFVEFLAKKFAVNIVYAGAKDKLKAIDEISARFNIPKEHLVYIGDSDRDALALEAVGLSIAPKDGTAKAKAASRYITDSTGSTGVLHEAVTKLISGELTFPSQEQSHEGSFTSRWAGHKNNRGVSIQTEAHGGDWRFTHHMAHNENL